jgi:hypothetical protein
MSRPPPSPGTVSALGGAARTGTVRRQERARRTTMIRTFISVLVALAGLSVGVSASAQSVPAVVWDVNDAILGGTGCSNADTAMLASGDDLSIIFSNLGVSLPGGSSNQLSDRKNCAVRVPTQIAKGIYIGQLTQTLTYGITKTAGSNGSVSTRSTFFGFDVSPYSVAFPTGSVFNVAEQVSSRKDVFFVNAPWEQGWCSPYRPLSGLYGANMAVAGTRETNMEDLIMFVDGLDLKFDVMVALYTC